MTLDEQFKLIRDLYQILNSTFDVDLILTYKGTSGGITKPFHMRIGNRETNEASIDDAVCALVDMLRNELTAKVKSAEIEAKRLKTALHSLTN